MLVHHTVGLRQQLGKAKLHRDIRCPYLRKGMGLFSEDVSESSIAPKQLCQRCGDPNSGQERHMFDHMFEMKTTPDGFEGWNPAMRGVFRKGYAAFLAGAGLGACPYKDKRKDDGRLTWSRAYQACWRDGWKHAEAGR